MFGKVSWVVRRAPRWLLRRAGVYTWQMSSSAKDLNEPIPDAQPPIDVDVSVASDSDLQRIREVLVEPFKNDFEKEANMGGTCFVAKSNGQIAGYSWVTAEPVKLVFRSLARYQPDAAYLYGSQVFQEYRGNKVFQCLTREIYIYLKKEGYRYACNLTHTNNAASITARRRMGARIDTLRFLKLPWLPLKVFGHRWFELAT